MPSLKASVKYTGVHQLTDRPVKAREIGAASGIHDLSFGVVRPAYYLPLQRVVDTTVKKGGI